jgi:hypothetical protein
MDGSASGKFTPRKRSVGERVAEKFAASRLGGWWYVEAAPPLDLRLIRWTGGRLTSGGRGPTSGGRRDA